MQFKKILKCDEYSFKYVKTILESFGYKSLNSPYYRFYVVIVDSNNYVLIKCDSKLSKKYNLSKYMMVNIEEFLYEAAKIAGKEYKRKDIVTADDLIGDISGFPIEVVQKMVDYQVKQGNAPDVTVFQKKRITPKANGGFNLYETEDGDLWSGVLEFLNFDLFFQKYPKKEEMTMSKFTKKDLIPGKHIVETNDGNLAIICIGANNQKYLQFKDAFSSLSNYDDDLMIKSVPNLSIKAVYEVQIPLNVFRIDTTFNCHKDLLNLVWTRNVVKLTDIYKTFNLVQNGNLIIELPNGNKIDIKVG